MVAAAHEPFLVRVEPCHYTDPPATPPEVLVIGYHAAFATPPPPRTPVAVFRGIDRASVPRAMPTYALVRIEHDPDPDGCSPHGLDYRLMPAEVDTTSFRWVLADGAWAAGGRHALLTRTVRERVPGAPIRIPIHDHNPDTGRRWTPTP